MKPLAATRASFAAARVRFGAARERFGAARARFGAALPQGAERRGERFDVSEPLPAVREALREVREWFVDVLSARAEHRWEGGDVAWLLADTRGPVGPSVIVHVESSYPTSLVELERNGGVIGRCTAPCDRSLWRDGTYRIDGRDIRSSWPFPLTGHSGERVTVTVAGSERSTYATAKTVGTVGGVAAFQAPHRFCT